MKATPNAAAIVGALADDARRSVFAAVQLGACTLDQVVEVSGLPTTQAAKALGRLVEVGLVAGSPLTVEADFLNAAARDALARPASTEYDGLPDDVRVVMKAFVVDGRLVAIPTVPRKRRIILDWLAQQFEPGHRYSERMVNLILGQRHADTAALRRYLVDEELLSREAGEYWRSGGTVVD